MQPGDVPATCAAIDRLAALTGFAPHTPLADGLARFVAWYREYYAMILVTGGAGFIGANFVLDWLDRDRRAARQPRQAHLRRQPRHLARCATIRGTSSCAATSAIARSVDELLAQHRPRAIVNFAAETHVDRSIHGPAAFVETNVVGTFSCSKRRARYWSALPEASAARSAFCMFRPTKSTARSGRTIAVHRDDAVRAELPVLGVEGGGRSSGARLSSHLRPADAHHQLLEQLRAVQFPGEADPADDPQRARGKPLPVYGDGRNVRDWLYVEDHCAAIRAVLAAGRPGETYNIGGDARRRISTSCARSARMLDELAPRHATTPSLMTFVKDRPGHDRRYAIDASKIRRELGWTPRESFETGMRQDRRAGISTTIAWLAAVTSGEYRDWISLNYAASDAHDAQCRERAEPAMTIARRESSWPAARARGSTR